MFFFLPPEIIRRALFTALTFLGLIPFPCITSAPFFSKCLWNYSASVPSLVFATWKLLKLADKKLCGINSKKTSAVQNENALIFAEEHKQKYQLFNGPMQSKNCSAHKKDQIALLYKTCLTNDNKKVTYIMHNTSLFFWGYDRCNSAIICGQLNSHGREIYYTMSCCTLGEMK